MKPGVIDRRGARLHSGLLLTLLLLTFLPGTSLLTSCGDDGPSFSIKAIEQQLYTEIRNYRLDEGLDGPFAHNYPMVGEAQLHSFEMANELIPVGTNNLEKFWDNIDELITVYNQDALVLKTEKGAVDGIFSDLLELSGAGESLKGDISLCGVGIEKDTEGNSYVTVLLAKADS